MNLRTGANGRGWVIGAFLASLVVAVPVLVVFSSVFRSSDGEWDHLTETLLPTYAFNTGVLAAGVCLVAGIVGVSTAWILTNCSFPGARILGWAQLLPLSVPAYLSAYAMADLLQFSGPVQEWLRGSFGLQAGDYWFPPIRSLGGAVYVLSFALYPYVYFAARMAFQEQSRSLLEAGRLLGRGPFTTFWFVALPLARPAIVGGVMLVMMETVADFGAVDHLAVDTFATGIYRTRFALESPVAASQLSATLLSALFLLVGVEWCLRRRRRYHRTGNRGNRGRGGRLGPVGSILAFVACVVPVLLGFVIPTGRLLQLAIARGDARGGGMLAGIAFDTVWLSLIASVIAVLLALVIGYAARLRRGLRTAGPATIARAGYAIPGPVIALGLLVPLGWIDHRINDGWTLAFGDDWRPGLVLTGSVMAMLIGYQTRFLAVSLSFVQSGFQRIHRNIDDAARTLGSGPGRSLVAVHLPLLRRSLLIAGLVVFVDVAKELPMTLMLRPFNFDTLAIRVYELASDERLEEAATAAILIVVIGLIPAWLLVGQLESNDDTHRNPDG